VCKNFYLFNIFSHGNITVGSTQTFDANGNLINNTGGTSIEQIIDETPRRFGNENADHLFFEAIQVAGSSD
jgi:hypothetical protein